MTYKTRIIFILLFFLVFFSSLFIGKSCAIPNEDLQAVEFALTDDGIKVTYFVDVNTHEYYVQYGDNEVQPVTDSNGEQIKQKGDYYETFHT